jgi:hypothetical protein
MNRKFLIAPLFLGIALPSCYYGGGGGIEYPLEISVNEVDIIKKNLGDARWSPKAEKILGNDIGKYNVLNFGEGKIEAEFRSGWDKYYNSRNFAFDTKEYKVSIPMDEWVSIFGSGDELLKKLEIPRYSTDAHAFEVVADGTKMLVVYVSQQTTSSSSTLFVLNEEFDVIYKEHLFAAQWIAAPRDPSFTQFVVGCGNAHMVDDERIVVGGPWLYSFGEPDVPGGFKPIEADN